MINLHQVMEKIKKKQTLSLGILLFLLVSLSGTVFLTRNTNFDIRKKAAEIKETLKSTPAPKYVPGEVIIKFKDQAPKLKTKPGKDLNKVAISLNDLEEPDIPQVLKNIDQKYKINKIEKIFKGKGEPQDELLKLKVNNINQKINEQEFLKINLSNVYKISIQKKESISQLIALLLSSQEVEVAEPNYLYKLSYTPNDPYFLDSYPTNVGSRDASWNPTYDYLWDMKIMKMPQGWDLTQGNSTIIVAVVDSGVDYNHPELAGKVIKGHNYIAENEDPIDDVGHGTHCSGTIAAITNNSTGMAGVCPNCQILAIKAFSPEGGMLDDLAQAVTEAADKGARVINASWGGPGTGGILNSAISYARSKNTMMVVAAGNDNANTSSSFPGSNPEVITVGASDQSDKRASFSNFGDRIDVAAPGGSGRENDGQTRDGANILSLRANNTDMYGDGKSVIKQNYYRARGTSMAAPHVSGLAGLLVSLHPDWSIEEIRQALRSGTDDIETTGWDIYTGFGRVNSQKTLSISQVNMAKIFSPLSQSFADGQQIIKGIAAGKYFASYTLEYGKGEMPTQWSHIISQNSPRLDKEGILGQVDISGWENGTYTFRLRVNPNNTLIPAAEDRVTIKKMRIKWYIPEANFSNEILVTSNPVVSDINDDGKLETIVGTNANMYIVSWDGKILTKLPLPPGEYTFLWGSTASAGELDPDYPGKEIIIQTETGSSGEGGKFRLFHSDGTEVINAYWPKSIQGLYDEYIESAPTLADVNGDGKLEIMTARENKVFLWDNEGKPFSALWPKTNIDASNVLAGKMRPGEELQLVTVDKNCYSPKVYIFSKEGEMISNWQMTISGYHQYCAHPPFTLSDVDNDGLDEIFVNVTVGSPYQTYIYGFKSQGQPLAGNWPIIINSGDSSNSSAIPIVIALKRGEGKKIVLNTNFGLEVRNLDGTLAWSWETGQGEVSPGVVLADLNGDGNLELGAATLFSPTVYFFNADGQPFTGGWFSNIYLGGIYGFINPVFTDIDNDNNPDFVIHTSGGGLGAYETGKKNWSFIEQDDWPMYFQNERHNGVGANICDLNRDLLVNKKDTDLFTSCYYRKVNSLVELKECQYADINHNAETVNGQVVHLIDGRDFSTFSASCSIFLTITPILTPTVAVTPINTPTPTPTVRPTSTPIHTPTPTVNLTATPTPGPIVCPTGVPPNTIPSHDSGNANCDSKIDIIDFNIWWKETTGQLTTTTADFNGVGGVNIIDFNIWWKTITGQNPTPTL